MKIVVATDGSSISYGALVAAIDLSSKLREPAELHVVAVVDYMVPPVGLGKPPATAPDLLGEEAESALLVAREIADEKGVVIHSHILRGHVASEIIRYASEIKADLIVLGTHGRRRLMHQVLGSACQAIVLESPVPVLTVHSQ